MFASGPLLHKSSESNNTTRSNSRNIHPPIIGTVIIVLCPLPAHGKGGRQCDLNTQSLSSVKNVTEKRKRQKNDYCNSSSSPCLKEKFGEEEMAAVKEVIGHVFGSEVIRELLHFQQVKVM